MKLNASSHQIANLPLAAVGRGETHESFRPRLIDCSAQREARSGPTASLLPSVDCRLEQAVWLLLAIASLSGLVVSFYLRE